ncbi:D-sedoheptulose-7-phosphate isomerase [Methylomicrobium lacus]|uniref:D-sedoheptulose-7-phosphate isomerase n=1 Tax=Methylomicrobium lacus TaxID=136992 RepID=UPI00045EAEEF|nr:D-sedoheptulose 7-phosphate isomerase [Methylomicrobium lacus]
MKTFMAELEQHQAMIEKLRTRSDVIESAGELLVDTLKQGGKILLCGNGGSAADCQHIAAEFVVRYEKHRRPLAAIALTTDSSILTAHSNDYHFDSVYARQVEALGNENDCLIAISTSGCSKNVLNAAEAAIDKGMAVIGLTGCGGGMLAGIATMSVVVPEQVTARIQEAHILIGHWWCGLVEEAFSDRDNA